MNGLQQTTTKALVRITTRTKRLKTTVVDAQAYNCIFPREIALSLDVDLSLVLAFLKCFLKVTRGTGAARALIAFLGSDEV